MAKKHTTNKSQKAKVEITVAEAVPVDTPVVEEVKAEVIPVVETPKKEAPKKETPKKVDKFDPKQVSQSTKKVTFAWSKGNKSGTKETMSENIAEIMEHQGLGKQVK